MQTSIPNLKLPNVPRLYTDFARYYDKLESQYRDYEKEANFLDDLFSDFHTNLVADISCGTASHLNELLKLDRENRRYVALDSSEQMISIAYKKLQDRAQVQGLLRGDFLALPFQNKIFDGAICMYWSLAGLELSQSRQLFAEAARILKPGGLFVFDVENVEGIKENLLDTPFIDSFFTDEETGANVIRVNYSRKLSSDLVDWRSYYLTVSDEGCELSNDRMRLRFYARSVLEKLLKDTGFEITKVYSSTEGNYEPNSPTLYFVAIKQT